MATTPLPTADGPALNDSAPTKESTPELYGPFHPLDQLSGSGIMKDGKEYEFTFRELEKWCQDQMKTYDRAGERGRLSMQRHNDKNYVPIQPYEGQRRYRRWRG